MDSTFFSESEMSAFSFSVHNVSFASDQSLSSNVMNEVPNNREHQHQQQESTSIEHDSSEQQEVMCLNDHDAIEATHENSADDSPAIDEIVTTKKAEESLYRPERKFSCREDLTKYIDDLKCFRLKSHNITNEGTVSYYICSLVPKRQANLCLCKLKIVEKNNTRDFCVFVTTFDHEHEKVVLKQNPVPQKTRDKIYELKTEYHMKPAAIHKYLAKEFPNEIAPTIKQIQMILPKEIMKSIPRTKK